MSQAALILRDIKGIFNNQGINNDVQIASHLGFILLVRNSWEDIQRSTEFDIEQLLTDLRHELEMWVSATFSIQSNLPQSPAMHLRGNKLYEIRRIIQQLKAALEASRWNTIDNFFHHEIRFQILKNVRRNSYPTPHHIADFIAVLGLGYNGAPKKVFDPVAGTAGLLVAALRYAPNAELIGCDFDPNIAEVGVANLLLHNPTYGIQFYQASFFTVMEQWNAQKFDSIIMAPPFDSVLSMAEVDRLKQRFLDYNYGRNTHTLLAAISMQILKYGGQAAFLLPTGSLFGSGGEERLRHILLHRYQLEAVITLNKELFQPYSGVAAHLIVVQKREPTTTNLDVVWFGDVGSDGYPSGAGRDLTARQDPSTNELPRMRELVLRTRTANWDLSLTLAEDIYLHSLLLQAEDGLSALGLVIAGTGVFHWQISALPSGVLVAVEQRNQAESDDTSLLARFYLSYRESTPIRLLPEQVAEVAWISAIPATWSPGLQGRALTTWQGDTDAITAQLNTAEVLTLKSGKSSTYRFQATDAPGQRPIVSFISRNGQPLTPWLALSDPQSSQALQAEDFAKKFAALPLFAANQEQCGWIIQLTAPNEAEEATTISDGALLLLFGTAATLYHTSPFHEWVALLPNGWLRITAQGLVHVEVGEAITLRDEVTPIGFAIGPTPPGSTEAYRVFAAAIPKTQLITTTASEMRIESFEPRRFLPEPPTAAIGHPSEIIANIRKSQARLGLQVDMLLNLLGSTAQKEQTTVDSVTGHPLTHLLATKQQHFWKQLQEQATAKTEPFYFTVDDLLSRFQTLDYREDFIRQQLDLFIRMGLIEAVHIGERNLYRLSVMARRAAVS